MLERPFPPRGLSRLDSNAWRSALDTVNSARLRDPAGVGAYFKKVEGILGSENALQVLKLARQVVDKTSLKIGRG